MKKIIFTTALLASTLFGVDYSTMSIDELNSLKGSIPAEERESFRAAMQSNMQSLTPEERATYRTSSGQGQGKMLRDGTGGGNMYKGSRTGGFGGGRN